MRRKDREILDEKVIFDVINECEIIRIGLRDGEKIYIVPLHFGILKGESYIFYCHGAKEGRKIDLIKKSDYVAFEMDTGQILITSEKACGFSSSYKSVMGEGRITLVEDNSEKNIALLKIMEHYSDEEWKIPEAALNSVSIIKIEVRNLSCKIHK